MGAQRLITEWVNFEYDPKVIKEQRQPGQPLIMKGILQKAETLNQNGRVYPKAILEREIRKNLLKKIERLVNLITQTLQ